MSTKKKQSASLSSNLNLNFIDDESEEDRPSSMCCFLITDKVLLKKLDKSFQSQSLKYPEIIFSTSKNLPNDNSYNCVLNKRLQGFNKSASEPPCLHSTPKKSFSLKDESNNEFELSFMSEVDDEIIDQEEDEDIKEGYLDTVWCSTKKNYISCDILYREDQNLSSLFCSPENFDLPEPPIVSSIPEHKDLSLDTNLFSSIQNTNGLLCENQPKQPFLLFNNDFDTNDIFNHKNTYRDKLVDGLDKNKTQFQKSSLPVKNFKPYLPSEAPNHLLTHDHTNLLQTIPPTQGSSVDLPFNSLKIPGFDETHQIAMNRENKNIKFKKQPKKLNKALDTIVTSTDHDKLSHDKVQKHNQIKNNEKPNSEATFTKLKSKKAHIQRSKENPYELLVSEDEGIYSPGHSPFSPNPSQEEAISSKTKKSQKTNKKMPEGDSVDGASKNKKRQKTLSKEESEEQLDSGEINFGKIIWWPLVSLSIIIAGIVFISFKDKITFMVSSKFPFEKPPI